MRVLCDNPPIGLILVAPTETYVVGPPRSPRSRANYANSGFWGEKVPFFTGVKSLNETLNCVARPEDHPSSSMHEPIPFEYRLMTKQQLAEYFGITERTIEVWMHRRYIPFIKIGQTVRFRVTSVLGYVEDKYLVPAGELQRRRKNHAKVTRGDTRPDAAESPFLHRCDAGGTPGA